jgi:hypothetical protein
MARSSRNCTALKARHHDGPIGNRGERSSGNGLLLWLEAGDSDAVMQRATVMGVEIVLPRDRNSPDGGRGDTEVINAFPKSSLFEQSSRFR